MKGWGESHGAVTVVNAIPSGRGATLGIDLRTEAEFLPGGEGLKVEIDSVDDTDDRLARTCAENMHLALDLPCEGVLKIYSEIPVSRGLKSSSSAANAICMAIRNAYDAEINDMDAIRIGCRSAIEAGVSITGAFDDACGCHLGGMVATDNVRMVLEAMLPDVGDYVVLIHVPEERTEKGTIDVARFQDHLEEFDGMVQRCMADPFGTMTENGARVAGILGIEDDISAWALERGALAAGVSGTGPAIAIIADEDAALSMKDECGPFITSRLRCCC